MDGSTRGRSIVIIGNGEPAKDVGSVIDGADIVIRFNACRTHGAAGRKTDIVAVCNTGRPAREMIEGGWRHLEPVQAAEAIWCVRHPAAMAGRRDAILARRPDLGDFFDDRTEAFAELATSRGQSCAVLPASVHERLDAALGFTAAAYVVPSSGLFVIEHVLGEIADPADSVAIVGFGHQGWDGHPFAAEREIVERHAGAGRLRRLDG